MLFKQLYKADIPGNAKRSTVKGTPCASWTNKYGRHIRAEVKVDSDGNEYVSIPTRKWSARYTDSAGRIVTRNTGCTDKDAAQTMLNGWLGVTQQVRAGHLRPEDELVSKVGPVLFEDAQREYIEALMKGWSKRSGKARPASSSHLYYTTHVLDAFRTERRIHRVIDFTLKAVQKHLDAVTTTGRSARTRNYHRAILSGFATYCYLHNYLPDNPVEKAHIADTEQDKRRPPRALTDAEVGRLLAIAETRPLQAFMENNRGCVNPEHAQEATVARLNLAGRERRLIYYTLVSTGLRWGELRAVRVCDLDLTSETPHVTLSAENTKAKQAAMVPVIAPLAAELQQWVKDTERFGAIKLFDMPPSGIGVFDRDIEAANIAKETEEGTACVHSLRHTCATRLARAGVPPIHLKGIMRHSSITTTNKYYIHLKLYDLHGAMQALPPLPEGEVAARCNLSEI